MSDKKYKCDYCPAKFTTNSNRLKHMKTSKMCLSSRQNVEIEIEIKCIWCNETFISSIMLESHYELCTVNKENAYMSLKKEYEKRIEELTAELEYANTCLDLYV